MTPFQATQATVELRKLALKRDPLVPVGETSPLHVDCPCGRVILIVGALNGCHGCKIVVDRSGWIQGRETAEVSDPYRDRFGGRRRA